MRVVELTAEQTHLLRRVVLRDNDPTRSVSFAEDGDPDAFHLGVCDDHGEIVATSTWVPRRAPGWPEARAIQLRGMATATPLQGAGLGGLLIEAGVQRCASVGFEVLWARARDTALAFYAQHGCEVVGDGFVDEVTQLAHHVVVRHIRPS